MVRLAPGISTWHGRSSACTASIAAPWSSTARRTREHLSRPGYIPTKIAVDISFANNGNNYLDLQIQFYLGEGGTTKGKAIGPLYSGNQFLNKDGTQIHIDFPHYKTLPVDVGFFEKLAVEINNSGGVNNILSISVVVYHEAKCWAELCATPSELC